MTTTPPDIWKSGLNNPNLDLTDLERRQVKREYQKLVAAFEGRRTKKELSRLRDAFYVALLAHDKQRRKSGEPYILHPLAVALIVVKEIGLGITSAMAALLHDTVEDTTVTLEDLQTTFGGHIPGLVDGLTKLEKVFLSSSGKDVSPQAANFRKVLMTLGDDIRIILVKLADRLHNMRTLKHMSKNGQYKIASETSYIYAPLAHRLGLYMVKTELQDLSMKYLEPAEYKRIAGKLAETKRDRDKFIKDFIDPLQHRLTLKRIPHRIFGRPKSIASITNKIKQKKVKFEDIYDLFAIRIILNPPYDEEQMMKEATQIATYNIESAEKKRRRKQPLSKEIYQKRLEDEIDKEYGKIRKEIESDLCWKVYSIVSNNYQPIPERLKDWVSLPKSNGYESLHTTVVGPKGKFVEVQIRTERMDEIAEKGFAAHFRYKGVSSDGNPFDMWLNNIRESLTSMQSAGDDVSFVTDIRNDLFKEEVFVFTPAGDLKVFPKGATALDFAFEIHTDIGLKCQALRINGSIVPHGRKLENGDQVEVVTSNSQKPKESWLKNVVTTRAKNKIRQALRREREEMNDFGRVKLDRKLSKLKVDYSLAIETVMKYYKYETSGDLFYAIYADEVKLTDFNKHFEVVDGRLIPIQREEVIHTHKTSDKKAPPKTGSGKTLLYINGQDASDLEYSLATCCNPIPGDEVFAYSSPKGIKVHRVGCENRSYIMSNFGYRVLKAEWKNLRNIDFVAKLLIKGVDTQGVVYKISDELSEKLNVDIRDLSIRALSDDHFEGTISVKVTNFDHLQLLMQTIQKMNFVQSVERIDSTNS